MRAGSASVAPAVIKFARAVAAVDGLGFGELQFVVHAQDLACARGDHRVDAAPFRDGRGDDVREVILALRIVVAKAREPGRAAAPPAPP